MNGNDTQGQPTTGALLQPVGSGYVAGCSGTLIGCQTFLTAAHCVCPGDTFCTADPTDFAVYLQHAGIVGVDNVSVHPTYEFNVRNDIAVLTLDAATTGIPPTPINTTATPALGTSGTIAGYGITSGLRDDSGILREGRVSTASCSGVAPEPAHVCWAFEAPIGLPGEDSNTCSGDSGGPLFVDFGSGAVVAGVTSGGTSSLCLGTDISFDANVFENRAFIEGIGGPDLANSVCGSISQVGDPETLVTELVGSGPPDSDERKCRGEVAAQVKRYATKTSALWRSCYDRVQKGVLPASCPDAATAAKLQAAAAKVDPVKLARKCPASALAGSRLGGICASAQNATELADCIVASVDAALTAMLDVQYADSPPTGPILDTAEAKCQRRISKEMRKYAVGKLAAMKSCRNRRDRGIVSGCPDSKSAERLTRLSSQLAPHLARDCGDTQVVALDVAAGFGGSCAGASTAAALASCQLADHDAQLDALVDLVPDFSSGNTTTFEVAAGTERFRVTLNAVDPFDGSNDLDLYLKRGAPASSTDFDLSSTGFGVFESIEAISPPVGTWHVLVETVAGADAPFQLTATTFEP